MGRQVEPRAQLPSHPARVRWSAVTATWGLLFITLSLGTELLTAWSAARSDPDDGADIGLGLVLMAGWALAAALAGGVDGWLSTLTRRDVSTGGLAVRWVVVGLAAGLAAAVYRSADDDALGIVDVLANFALSTFIESVLVAGPAIVTAVVAEQLAANRMRQPHPPGTSSANYAGPWDASG